MNIYNDTDVGDPNTFASYTTHNNDKTLTWSVDTCLPSTRAHDTGTTKTFAMTAIDQPTEQGVTTYHLSR